MTNVNKGRNRKSLIGIVISKAMNKTVVVDVTKRMRNLKYHKIVDRMKKYKAHDLSNGLNLDDVVEIVECRPLSRDKRWRVARLVQKAAARVAEVQE